MPAFSYSGDDFGRATTPPAAEYLGRDAIHSGLWEDVQLKEGGRNACMRWITCGGKYFIYLGAGHAAVLPSLQTHPLRH